MASRSAGTYQFHSSGRAGGNPSGNSASEGSDNVQSFDMGMDLTSPTQARRPSKGDSEWSDENQTYSPVAYNPTPRLPV